MNYNLIRRTPVYQKELRFILYNFRHTNTTADHLLINKKYTLLEKREICVLKQSKPTPTNKDLAIRFKIHENTVSNILKRKSENLNKILFRLRHTKYPGLEDALILSKHFLIS